MCPAVGHAGVLTFDFESFAPDDLVTTQIPGLSILNGIIFTAGVNYNDAELPPHSGFNVLSDNGGPITINFTTPVLSFRAFFTYVQAVTLTGFNLGLSPVSTATAAFGSKLAISGDPGSSPNELLEVTNAAGLSRVVIEGNPAGGSFVLDDASI